MRSLVVAMAAGLCACAGGAPSPGPDLAAGGTSSGGGSGGGGAAGGQTGGTGGGQTGGKGGNAVDAGAGGTSNTKDAAADMAAQDGAVADARVGSDAPLGLPDGGTSLGMKLIQGGTFTMGDPGGPPMGPAHRVTVSPFYMDATEVTQGQYVALLGVNPSHNKGDLNLPVDSVTWYDAVLYCNERSKREGKDPVYQHTGGCTSGTPGNRCKGLANLTTDMAKNGYRLATEAEWEYATRAGTTTTYFWGNDTDPTRGVFTKGGENYAWYWSNAGDKGAAEPAQAIGTRRSHPVATKLANPWGLFDMSGNLYEWVNDWAAPYSSAAQTDPTGPANGTLKVGRGGSWYDINVGDLRSATRWLILFSTDGHEQPESLGFRTVRSAR